MNLILDFKEFFTTPLLEKKKKDNLAGIVLIVDNKLLLVKPKKFKGMSHKWSIPKGRIEKGSDNIETAFKELQEETGIRFKKQKIYVDDIGTIKYKKSGRIKILDYYVVKLKPGSLNISINKDGIIPKKFYKGGEIYKAKFMDYKEASTKIEWGQSQVIDYLFQK